MEDVEQSNREKILRFQEVCDVQDETLAKNFLEYYDYSLEVAIHNFLNPRDEAANLGVSNDASQQNPRSKASVIPSDSAPKSMLGRWFGWIWLVLAVPYRFISLSLYEICVFLYNSFVKPFRVVTDPVTDVANFVAEYESKYGSDHPAFYQGSYSMALADAKRNLNYLLVYLHSPRHQDTDEFCRSVLSNQEVIQFVNTETMFWACSVDFGEGYKVSMAMRETTYPFLALICLRGRKMMIVLRQQGLCTPWELMDILRTAISDNSVYMSLARQERADREFNQVLRQQQEAAYLECLHADQLKETQRREEERQKEEQVAALKKEEDEKRFLAEQVQAQKSLLLKSLPAEPPSNSFDSLRISLKFPNGTRYERRFLPKDPVTLLRDVTFTNPNCPDNFAVLTVYPRKVLLSKNDHLSSSVSLKDIGIDGSVSLIVHDNDA